MSLHCAVQNVDLFVEFIRMFSSPAICYRSYLLMKNDLYCPLWTAFWPRSAFGWFIKKNIVKGTTDPRVEFILLKLLLEVISEVTGSAKPCLGLER